MSELLQIPQQVKDPVTLRPRQKEAHAAIMSAFQAGHKKVLAAMPTGFGKTVTAGHGIRRAVDKGNDVLVLAHAKFLVEQFARSLREKYGLDAEVQMGGKQADGRVVCSTIQTERSLVAKGTSKKRGLVVIDECFPPGVMVGSKPIESLSVGDTVPAFDHALGEIVAKRVTATMRSRPGALCSVWLSDGRRIVCTPGHPIWDGGKYACAITFSEDNMVYETTRLLGVRDELRPEILEQEHDPLLLAGMQAGGVQEKGENHPDELRPMREDRRGLWLETLPGENRESLLQQGVFVAVQGEHLKHHNGGYEQEVCVGQDEGEQPHAEPGVGGKDEKVFGRYRTQAAYQGRKRERCDKAAAITPGFSITLGTLPGARRQSERPSNRVWARKSAELLQDRHRHPGIQGSHRGRRELAWATGKARAGQEKGVGIVPIRVDRVEVHEPGSDGEFELLCPGGLVYNIEVEHTNNYFADGILVHNCHHGLSPTYQDTFEHHCGKNGSFVLGITATPCRGDQKDLMKFFDIMAVDMKLEDEIRDGNLSPLRVVNFPVEIDLSGCHSVAGDFRDDEVGHALEPCLEACAAELAKYKGRRMLVFLPLISLAKQFRDIAAKHGLDLRHVDGGMKPHEIKAAVAALEAKGCDGIVNPYLMSEGVDIPCVDLILNLRPTKSWVLYMQINGRGTRLYPGKQDCILLDPLWLCDEHSMVRRPSSLLAHDEEEAAFIDEAVKKGGAECPEGVDLLEAAKAGRDDRSASLVARLRANKGRDRRVIDPLEFACLIGFDDLVGYTPVSPWESEPVSDGQAAVLKRHAVAPESCLNRGHASKVIDMLFKHMNAGGPTPRQCAYAEELGMEDPYHKPRYEVADFLERNAPKKRRWGGGKKKATNKR